MSKRHKTTDGKLDQALAESFPASDPISLTRAPRDKQANERPASRADRKAPHVLQSAEGQPDRKP